MYVKDIVALSFRNFQELNAGFSEGINLIYGENGSGKTNFLEAIHFSLTGKSFRTKNDNNLIMWGRDRVLTETNYVKNGQKKFININFSTKTGKEINLNGMKRTKTQSLFYETNLVVFTPASSSIIRGEPFVKRHFLDRLSLKLNKEFALIMSRYTQTLRNRNALLKNYDKLKSSKTLFDILTEELVNLSKIIQKERLNMVSELNLQIAKITGENEQFKNLNDISIRYEPTAISKEKAESLFKEEIKRKITLLGAHIDNVNILDKDFSVRDFSSEGEQKLATILLKLCELNILENKTKNVPILIIDDIASELDLNNTQAVLKYVKDRSQVFITACLKQDITAGKIFKLPVSEGILCLK
jgi:DNA replication and repair protein RecF